MNILVTDKEEAPEGWLSIPVNDVNVHYDPKTTDEGEINRMVEDFANGEMDEMYENADFDLPTDRE